MLPQWLVSEVDAAAAGWVGDPDAIHEQGILFFSEYDTLAIKAQLANKWNREIVSKVLTNLSRLIKGSQAITRLGYYFSK